jgi:Asp-tRNA(Asn)/Glu-tRNA(Gln) amidotransferase C subunit
MPITEADIKKIADLAHLDITPEEGTEVALDQAPDASNGHFRVPRVLAGSPTTEDG